MPETNSERDRTSVSALVTIIVLAQMCFVVVATFVMIGLMTWARGEGMKTASIDPMMASILGSVVSAVTALAGGVVGYWTGSSIGAKDSNEALRKIASNAVPEVLPEKRPPVDVNVASISPYAQKTDDELLTDLVARGEDPDKSALLTREERIKLLTDLDLASPDAAPTAKP